MAAQANVDRVWDIIEKVGVGMLAARSRKSQPGENRKQRIELR
jgi:hypothetical protein